jgi:hypothetical protein
MAFSHIKIKAADHGSRSEVWVDGVKHPGLFDVNFDTKVASATVATLKMYTTAEAEGDAQVNRIVLCPACHEEFRGTMSGMKFKARFLGFFRGLRRRNLRPKETTQMGDANRTYIAT